MGRAVWCDAKDAGHAIDERTAIVLAGQAGTYFYCGPHSLDAFQKAMVIAEGKCGLHFPPVGDLAITCDGPTASEPSAAGQTATTLGTTPAWWLRWRNITRPSRPSGSRQRFGWTPG